MSAIPKKISIRIIFLIGIQIAIISVSFLILETLESQKIFSGNSVNIAGKNRFLTELVLNSVKDYYMGGKLTVDPTLQLAIYEKNLQLLKTGGTEMDTTIPPLSKNFQRQWENIHNLYLDYKTKIQSFVESDSTGPRETKLVEISDLANKLVEQNNILTGQLALEAQNLTTMIISLQISLLILNIGVHPIIMKLIYNILKSEADRLAEMEREVTKDKNYKSLYNGMPDLCRTVDEKGLIVDCNTTYANSLGYSKEEIIGKSIFDHVDERSISDLCLVHEVWKKTGIVKSKEFLFKRKDGTSFPVLLHANKFIHNNKMYSNTIIRDVSNIHDMTKELEKNEKKLLAKNEQLTIACDHLSELEQRYRRLYEQSPDLVRTIDMNEIITDCNEKYCSATGFSRDEIVGKSLFVHVAKKSYDDMKHALEEWKHSEHINNIEIWLQRKDGSIFPTLLLSTNLYDRDGHLCGRLGNLRDMSDFHVITKELEEQKKTDARLRELLRELSHKDKLIKSQLKILRERNTQKEAFSSMISHELKTPIVPIKGYCEMFQNGMLGNLTEEQIGAINEISDNSSRMEKLILNLLDLNKLEIGQLSVNKKVIRTDDFVERVFAKYNPIITQNNIKFLKSVEASTISADPDRMMQIFENLIQNAMSFTPDEEGTIEIGVKNTGFYAIFYVKDNGIGISMNAQSNLFKPFYQVDTSSKRKHGGTGLGLSICKGLVETMGGRIWVESEEGKGTTFFFEMPKTEVLEITTNSNKSKSEDDK